MDRLNLKSVLILFLLLGLLVSSPFPQTSKLENVELEYSPKSLGKISPSQTIDFKVLLSPPPGVHINANPEPDVVLSEKSPFKVLNSEVKGEVKTSDKLGMEVYRGNVNLSLKLELENNIEQTQNGLQGEVRYYPCDDRTGTCYRLTESFDIPVESISGEETERQTGKEGFTATLRNRIEAAFGDSILWLFVLVYIGGVLSSFTPCVYPMIPITVGYFGANKDVSKLKVFLKALLYLLGIAIVYSTFGIIAASTGKAFGSLSGKPPVLFFVGGILVIMAFSMMGLFEIKIPDFAGSSTPKKGYIGAFFVGALSGLVASPCLTPILISLLALVAKSGNMVFGFFLLFVFALGLGTLLVIIALFSSATSFLPSSGSWMKGIQFFLGAVLVYAGSYFLGLGFDSLGLNGNYVYLPATAMILIFITVKLNPFSTGEEGSFNLFRTFSGFILILLSIFLIVQGVRGMILTEETTLLFSWSEESSPIEWENDLDEALERAEKEDKPVIVDFWADWCVYCKKLEETTFKDKQVVKKFNKFIPLRINYDKNENIAERYGVKGLPTTLFLNSSGEPINRVSGYVGPDPMLEEMNLTLDKFKSSK